MTKTDDYTSVYHNVSTTIPIKRKIFGRKEFVLQKYRTKTADLNVVLKKR